jgi:hypothetical protein
MALGFFETIARDLTGRGQFRLILQPVAALILGIRLGIADAKAGKGPFLLRLVSEPHGRWILFKESLSDAVLPLTVALVIDAVLQSLMLRHVRPLVAVLVGGLLVWLPFAIARALSNRAWRRIRPRSA